MEATATDRTSPAGQGPGGRNTGLVLVSILSVQLGAGFARRLFDDVGPASVVMMRQGGAAVVLLAVARPRLTGRSRRDWTTVLGFGAVLAAMNLTFYEAVARLPLGLAVTIELLGPLGLAVALSRRWRELLWCGVAVLGVVLLGEGGPSIDPLGIAFAVAAAVCWGGYILLSGATGRRFAGVDGLAIAMAAATLISSPIGLRAGTQLFSARVLLLGALVALLSGLVPFSLEITALRHVPPRVFGVLMSLSPAAATLSGFVILSQRLTGWQLVAMAMVIVASAATVLGAKA